MLELLETLYEKDEKKLAPSEIINKMGQMIDDENSIMYWANKNEIPIIVPGIMDGSVGSQIWSFSEQHKDFTLDVLKSYVPVKRWFKLRGKGEDVELPESRGKKELIKWVDSNPETITRKVEIILEHLLNTTVKSIEGRGKGMVIVRSIEDTVKFYMELNKQLIQKGLQNKIKCLIGCFFIFTTFCNSIDKVFYICKVEFFFTISIYCYI